MTEQSMGLLTPFQISASVTASWLLRHVTCGKGRPPAAASATNHRQIQHWAADLDARLAEHGTGECARLLAMVHAAGIDWNLARTWPGLPPLRRTPRPQHRHCGDDLILARDGRAPKTQCRT